MAGRELDRTNRLFGAVVTGLMAVGGLFWLGLAESGAGRAGQGGHRPAPDGHAAGRGAPAGWFAGVSFRSAPYPVFGAMAGGTLPRLWRGF